jgi:hypothetical protein
MTSEGPHQDLKRSFDDQSPKALLDLVKDVVSIANTGGGRLIYGRTDTEVIGLTESAKNALDGAKVADLVDKYVAPFSVQISHEVQEPEPGKFAVLISIEPASSPLVISQDGGWRAPGEKHDKVVLRKGDIWVRHSSKNEHATFEDLRGWLMVARSSERAAIFERMAMLVNLPEGSSLEVVTKSGSHIDTPSQLIQSARDRRKWDPDHLLSADDLSWIFAQRAGLALTDEDLRILIAGSLRKGGTLHYWVALAEYNPGLIVDELMAVLSAGDRDKSDASSNVVELAAVYADETTLRKIIEALRASGYKHFREAAESWHGRVTAQRDLFRRIRAASNQGKSLDSYSQDELEQLATEHASMLIHEKSSAMARRLSDINRLIWARRTGRASLLDGQPIKR